MDVGVYIILAGCFSWPKSRGRSQNMLLKIVWGSCPPPPVLMPLPILISMDLKSALRKGAFKRFSKKLWPR